MPCTACCGLAAGGESDVVLVEFKASSGARSRPQRRRRRGWPAEPKCVPATRTVRLRIGAGTNAGKLAALAATVAEWDQAVCCYTNIFLDHPGVFEAHRVVLLRSGPDAGTTKEVAWSEQDRLTWAESVTVATSAHPHIPPERDFEAARPGGPRDLRRAAIHAGSGAVPSHPKQPPALGGRKPQAPGTAAETTTAAPPPDGLRRDGPGAPWRLPPGLRST